MLSTNTLKIETDKFGFFSSSAEEQKFLAFQEIGEKVEKYRQVSYVDTATGSEVV